MLRIYPMAIIINFDLLGIINNINKKILDINILRNVFKNTIINIPSPNKWLYQKTGGEHLFSSF